MQVLETFLFEKIEVIEYMNISEATESENMQFNLSPTDSTNVDVIGAAYGEANKKLVEFVSKNIELMQSHLLKDSIPDIQSINKAYIDYLPISFSLNNLYQKVKFDASKAQHEYELFDDQAMYATKTELNRDDNKKTWYSATELKNAAHTKYKSMYAKLNAKVDLAEGRRSFVERLCKAWDSWQFGLGQISRNLIAEANANGLDMKAQQVMPVDPDDMRMERLVDQAMGQV